MAVWFEGSLDIDCGIQEVAGDLEDYGKHLVGVIGLLPSLTKVELVEQGSDFATLKTNEGTMKRTNVSKRVEADNVVLEFDEEYRAGSKMVANTHFLQEFKTSETGVKHHIVMSNVRATGLLGFFYRTFGGSNTGNAFLASYKTHFERLDHA